MASLIARSLCAKLIGPVNPRASVQACVSDYSVCRVHGLNHLELNKEKKKEKKTNNSSCGELAFCGFCKMVLINTCSLPHGPVPSYCFGELDVSALFAAKTVIRLCRTRK